MCRAARANRLRTDRQSHIQLCRVVRRVHRGVLRHAAAAEKSVRSLRVPARGGKASRRHQADPAVLLLYRADGSAAVVDDFAFGALANTLSIGGVIHLDERGRPVRRSARISARAHADEHRRAQRDGASCRRCKIPTAGARAGYTTESSAMARSSSPELTPA